jgi:hypothetical protein
LSLLSHFQPSQVLVDKVKSLPLEWLVPVLTPNIGLGWKWVTMASTLPYNNTKLITTVKSFTVQAQWKKLKY